MVRVFVCTTMLKLHKLILSVILPFFLNLMFAVLFITFFCKFLFYFGICTNACKLFRKVLTNHENNKQQKANTEKTMKNKSLQTKRKKRFTVRTYLLTRLKQDMGLSPLMLSPSTSFMILVA